MNRKVVLTALALTVLLSASPVQAQSASAIREYNLGIKAYNRGNAQEAIRRFRQAASLDATYVDAYYNMASIYYQQQNYTEARDAFKQALMLRPTDSQARYNLALTHEKLNEFDEAIRLLSQIEGKDPKFAQAQAKMADLRKRVQAMQPRNPQPSLGQYGALDTSKGLPAATFSKGYDGPTGMTIGPGGFLYVANYTQNLIYKVGADGEKAVFVKDAGLKGPIGLTHNPKTGELYVANYLENNIVRITPDGKVSVLAGGLNKPYYLYLDTYNNLLFVSEQGSNTVSRIALP